jgi:hypothetical protein
MGGAQPIDKPAPSQAPAGDTPTDNDPKASSHECAERARRSMASVAANVLN